MKNVFIYVSENVLVRNFERNCKTKQKFIVHSPRETYQKVPKDAFSDTLKIYIGIEAKWSSSDVEYFCGKQHWDNDSLNYNCIK